MSQVANELNIVLFVAISIDIARANTLLDLAASCYPENQISMAGNSCFDFFFLFQ